MATKKKPPKPKPAPRPAPAGPMTERDKLALLALTWLPGIGWKFAQMLQSVLGGQDAANRFIGANTNYTWNQAAVRLISGTAPQTIIDQDRVQMYEPAWSDIPTIEDMTAMSRIYASVPGAVNHHVISAFLRHAHARDAGSGRYVTQAQADANPETTVKERTKRKAQ